MVEDYNLGTFLEWQMPNPFDHCETSRACGHSVHPYINNSDQPLFLIAYISTD